MSRTVVSLVMLDTEQRDSNAERIGTDKLLNPGTASTSNTGCNPIAKVARRGRPRKTLNKDTNKMTPAPNEKKYSDITKTVFDLSTFDDVKLVKPFNPPAEPTTLQDALAAVGNDQSKLLNLIHKGLVAEARDVQYEDMSGFKLIGEDGEVAGEYTGSFADESQGKLINAGILTMAKLYAGGAWESKSKDEKKALKEKAAEFIRSNPAMLASFAPAAPAAA